MIASDYDRRRELTTRDEIVQRHTESGALTLSQPADARRQSLEVHAFARHRDPAAQMLVVRKQVEHQLVGAREIVRIAGERHPAERTLPFTEQRAHVLRHESWYRERIFDTVIRRDGP